VEKQQQFCGILKRFLESTVAAIGLVLFGYLTWHSFRVTYLFAADYSEMFDVVSDNPLLHILVFVFCIVLIGGLGAAWAKFSGWKEMPAESRNAIKRKAEKTVLFLILFLSAIAGAFWVSIVHAEPCADQLMVINSAFSLMDGNYEVLKPDQYLGQYPFQLGLTVVFRFLFTVFGTRDYRLIQYCNVLCLPAILFAGYKIVKYMGGKSKAGVFYCLLTPICFPLLFYAPFVYGEIFSVMAGMIFVGEIMAFLREEQKRQALAIILCSVLGVLTRGNFWIVIIAAGIVLVLYGVKRRSRSFLLLLVLIVGVPMCVNRGLERRYEQCSGIALDQGIPIISWIAMGVHDEGSQPAGWSNLHNYYAYAGNDFNKEAAAEFSGEYLRGRIEAFRNGSADWKAYFKEKLLTQWEEPTWQSLLANHDFEKEPGEFVYSIYYGNLKNVIIIILNEYQWALYIGTCLFFIYCWAKKKQFFMLLPEIILIGGVLFSLIWEAKARYSFPYMIYMLPCAAIGLTETSELAFNKLWKNRNDKAGCRNKRE